MPSVELAGLYTGYDLQVLGCTRHRSGCPISLRDVVLISLATETKRYAVSHRTLSSISLRAGRQRTSRKTSHHAIKTQRPLLGERFTH